MVGASTWLREQWRHREVWLLSALVVACAFRAYLYYHPDEQYSVVDFVGFKLGWTPEETLPWDYRSAVRPWLQPGLYYLFAKAARRVGLDGRFHYAEIFRLVTGALCVAAQVVLARWSSRASGPSSRAFVREALLLSFLPYLFTRTNAEALSGALLAFAWVAYFAQPETDGPAPHRPARGLVAGVLFGLAFDVRPHTAIFACALLAWSLVHERRPLGFWGSLVAGGLVAVGLMLVVDRWGYGRWVFSPWQYLSANLIEGKVTSLYGSSPWYAYAYLLLENPFAPLVLYCLAVTGVAVARNPRHPLVWGLVALVVAMSATGHKEDRFLFPLAPFFVVLFPLAFRGRMRAGAEADAPSRWLPRLRRAGLIAHAAGAVALAWMLFVAYGNCNLGTARAIERSERPDGAVLVLETHGRPFARHPFYERVPWITTEREPVLGVRVIHLVAYDQPRLVGVCPSPELHGRCVRRWSELPGTGEAHDTWLARLESMQEALRSRFAPETKPHPTWYAVYDFYPAPAAGPPPP